MVLKFTYIFNIVKKCIPVKHGINNPFNSASIVWLNIFPHQNRCFLNIFKRDLTACLYCSFCIIFQIHVNNSLPPVCTSNPETINRSQIKPRNFFSAATNNVLGHLSLSIHHYQNSCCHCKTHTHHNTNGATPNLLTRNNMLAQTLCFLHSQYPNNMHSSTTKTHFIFQLLAAAANRSIETVTEAF